MNFESKVPTVKELVEHFRAQANWKGPPPRYWIVAQKGKGGKVEPKIEMVTPIAQELKRATSDVKRMKREGESMPEEPIVTPLKPQRMRGPPGKRNKNSKCKGKRNKKTLGKL
jgi:hypothetical protein